MNIAQGRAGGVAVLMDLLDGSRQFLVAAEDRYLELQYIWIQFLTFVDENEISLYIISTCLNIEVITIKELITKDKMS